MQINEMKEEEILRGITEQIETEFGEKLHNISVEVSDEEITIEGAVPSRKADESLERILFDTLGFENITYDVVVDEDLQSTQKNELRPSKTEQVETNSRLDNPRSMGNDRLNQSPRRQF